jgi:hypothetical protein
MYYVAGNSEVITEFSLKMAFLYLYNFVMMNTGYKTKKIRPV